MSIEPPRCCDGFHRAQAMRGALAAGRAPDPREWDPRMPVPAGAGLDRRGFLLGAAGGLLSVYGAGRMGLGGQALGEGIAQAAATQAPDSPVLVSIFLAGGIDALSVLAPTQDPLYQKLRPSLAVAPGSGHPFSEDARADLAPGGRAAGRSARRGEDDRHPGGRLQRP